MITNLRAFQEVLQRNNLPTPDTYLGISELIRSLYRPDVSPNPERIREVLEELTWPVTVPAGNPITFKSCSEVLASKVLVTFAPKQSGTGDPSPSNIRPISGWDSLVLNQSGKNMSSVNLAKNIGWAENNDNLVDVFNSLPIGDYALSFGVKVNSVTQSVNSWSYGMAGVADGVEYRYRKTVLSAPTVNYTDNTSFTMSITKENVGKFTKVYLYGCGNNTIGKAGESDITNIQIESGSTMTEYEPYQGQTHTATFPSTEYGGSYDFVSGEGVSEWGYIASYNGETITEPWISDRDVYVTGTTPSTGAEVVYKLATPTAIALTPADVNLLKGLNTVWTDGDTVQIKFQILK